MRGKGRRVREINGVVIRDSMEFYSWTAPFWGKSYRDSKGHRHWISAIRVPKEIATALNLKTGDMLEIAIRKVSEESSY